MKRKNPFLPCLLLSAACLLSACQKPQMPETTSSSVAESESLPMSSSATSSSPKSESNPKPASSSKPTSTSTSTKPPSSNSSISSQSPSHSQKPQAETPPGPTGQQPTSTPQPQPNPPAETPPPPPAVDAGTCIAEARAYALGKGLTEDGSLNTGNSGFMNPPDISVLSQDSVIADLKYCIDVYASYSPDDPSLVHFNIVQSGNLIYVLYQ